MKKIIVPVDFSNSSEHALKVAASLAKKHKAELLLLHMLDISDQLISITESTQRREIHFFIELAKKRMEDFIKKDYLKDISITAMIKHLKVFEEVNKVAIDEQADLIVMGSRGASGIKGYFTGSNTERVVRTSEVPVLVIKKKTKKFLPETILFASDFKPENSIPFQKVRAFAASFQAKLKLVYINTPNATFKSTHQIKEQMRQFLSAVQIPIHSDDIVIYNDFTIEEGIFNAAENLQADLIAIPTHGRKGINKVLAGSISNDVTNQSSLPVLTLKI